MVRTYKCLSSVSDVLEFYNKYLALDYDDYYLVNLITKLANKFMAKVSKDEIGGILANRSIDIEALKFNDDDTYYLSCFEKKCIRFHTWASIKLTDNAVANIDRFGTIAFIDALDDKYKCYEGKNIFELIDNMPGIENSARKDAMNVLIQNRFASKMYKAIKEIIKIEGNYAYKTVFGLVNEGILNYEEDLANKNIELAHINNGFSRQRSKR